VSDFARIYLSKVEQNWQVLSAAHRPGRLAGPWISVILDLMTLRIPTLLLAVCAGAVPILGATSSTAKGPEIFPLSQVRPGQKGYGLTVFQGTTPERFDFEVIGIVKNMMPKMDIILIKSDDPKVQLSGMAMGMSGSPLFIDGRLACAFAYSWSFNKLAMGGCTPIEYMLKEVRPAEKGEETASRDEWDALKPLQKFADAQSKPDDRDGWLLGAPLPARPPAPAAQGMVRAGIPLAVNGLGPSAFEQTRRIFEAYHVEPMQGIGGGGDPNSGPAKFEIGGNIAVKMISGDISAAATCAVSYVDGPAVLGCGHPIFGVGKLDMPVATAQIHTIVPSANIAFKVASPLRVAGALVNDRKAAIVADSERRSQIVPVDVRIKNGHGEQELHSQLVEHRFLTPQLATMTMAAAVELMSPDVIDATMTLRSTVYIKGFEPLTFTDYLYSPEGLSLNAISTARGLRALVPLLFNPFEPLHLERIQIEASLAYKADFAELQGLKLPDLELPFDQDTYVDAVLRPYNGKEYTTRIPLRFPRRLAGSLVKLEVVPGNAAKPDSAPPENLAQLVDALRTKTFPANVLVATVYTPSEGVTLGGRVLPDLPDSALDTARPAAATKTADPYKSILRATVPLKQVVTGKQELVVKIADIK